MQVGPLWHSVVNTIHISFSSISNTLHPISSYFSIINIILSGSTTYDHHFFLKIAMQQLKQQIVKYPTKKYSLSLIFQYPVNDLILNLMCTNSVFFAGYTQQARTPRLASPHSEPENKSSHCNFNLHSPMAWWAKVIKLVWTTQQVKVWKCWLSVSLSAARPPAPRPRKKKNQHRLFSPSQEIYQLWPWIQATISESLKFSPNQEIYQLLCPLNTSQNHDLKVFTKWGNI